MGKQSQEITTSKEPLEPAPREFSTPEGRLDADTIVKATTYEADPTRCWKSEGERDKLDRQSDRGNHATEKAAC